MQKFLAFYALSFKLTFLWSSQVIETTVKVSPFRGTEQFAPVLLKIFHMILEVEVKFLIKSLFKALYQVNQDSICINYLLFNL